MTTAMKCAIEVTVAAAQHEKNPALLVEIFGAIYEKAKALEEQEQK